MNNITHTQHNPETYLKQKDKYNNRMQNFLLMAGGGLVGTMALVAFAPAATVAIGAAVAFSGGSVLSAGANKLAELNTDTYEPLGKREQLKEFISSKISNFRKEKPEKTNTYKV